MTSGQVLRPARTAMATVRRAPPRSTRQRERILDAAERSFIAHGFHGASMAQIAAGAAVSPGLIYRYFPSKSALVLSIIGRHVESQDATAIGDLNTIEDLSTLLLDVFERWRRRDDPRMNAALLLELTVEVTRDPRSRRRCSRRTVGSRPRSRGCYGAWRRRAGCGSAPPRRTLGQPCCSVCLRVWRAGR